MSEFIAIISQILSIELTIGTVTLFLGNIAFGYIVLRVAINKFFAMSGLDPLDVAMETLDERIREQQRQDADHYDEVLLSRQYIYDDGLDRVIGVNRDGSIFDLNEDHHADGWGND